MDKGNGDYRDLALLLSTQLADPVPTLKHAHTERVTSNRWPENVVSTVVSLVETGL
jgi:hypothetical protein